MRATALLLCVTAALFACAPARAGVMKEYQTKYYVIYSDHDEATIKEATLRVTAMAEEYYERTKDFSRKVRQRMPFYLYSDEADYKAAGGVAAGYYTGTKLMAYLPGGGGYAWHIIQHEGFHQFAHAATGGHIPIWVDEGLAEYFGEGVWTGDAFVTGLITSRRLEHIRALIQGKKLKPFQDMLNITSEQWRVELGADNYDQAWSMVHFLVHGNEGKYQKAFAAFLVDCSMGQPPAKAFTARFGNDLKSFEDTYRAWWTALPEHPSNDGFSVVVCHTCTSFLARATSAGQRFKDAREFFDAIQSGKLQIKPEDWLPPSLTKTIATLSTASNRWSIDYSTPHPRMIFNRADGVTFIGEYAIEGREYKTKVEIKRPARPES